MTIQVIFIRCNHHRNIHALVDIYKIKNNLNPPIMDFMFERVCDEKKKNCKNGMVLTILTEAVVQRYSVK